MEARPAAARAWDEEYARGRYRADVPVALVADVLSAARARGLVDGLYVGCGNGRNYLPLVDGGLRLVGLDVSRVAIEQLAARAPAHRDRLVVGDLDDLPSGRRFDLVIGLQVFQHGDRATAHEHLRRAQARVAPGGLMAVRVNAAATEMDLDHTVCERGPGDGFTAHYREGSKAGLDVRFFSREELIELLSPDFVPLLGPRSTSHRRSAPRHGRWAQWEGIWARRGGATAREIPRVRSLP